MNVCKVLQVGVLIGLLQGSVLAATLSTPSLGAARAAVEDGLYDLAQKQLDDILKTTGRSTPEGEEAVVLLARALWGQGRYDAMLRAIGDEPGKIRSEEAGALVYWHAVARYELSQWDKALVELQGFAGRYAGDPYVARAGRLEAWCQLKAGRVGPALGAFEQFDRQYGDKPEGLANLLDWGQALLASGDVAGAYADKGLNEKAADEYQYYLETFTDPAGQTRALKGRGLALWALHRYAEAASVFEKAAALAKGPAEKEQCLVKAADALFANAQYKLAVEAYGRVLTEFPSSSLAPQTAFQLAESLGRQGEWAHAGERFRELVRSHPGSPFAERALMRIAEMKEEQGPAFMREALAAYAEVMDVYPNGVLFAEALYRHGLAAYQLLQFDEALKDFSRVVSDCTNSPVVPQAFFMRGRSLYMMGREEEALAVGRTFVERYPDTVLTAGVMFWLGEYAFNHSAYPEAERQFLLVAAKFPRDALADQALLWAGRSAMKQKEYVRAVDSFTRVAETYPDSTRMPDARFLQGDALSELGEFSRAIVVFDELIAKYPANPLVGAAWGRKGDCQFTLGASDSKRYDEAVASYRAVTKSPGLTFDLELQAEFKIGRCLDKLGRKPEAFEQYYTKVVVGYLEHSEAAPHEVNAAAAVWFTKAAFAAADILEADKNWRRAVKVLERVVNARAPAARDAQERIDRIRAEHWIW